MKQSLTQLFTKLHVSIYNLSDGRIGNKLGKQSMLLLHTVGRRSRKRYKTTLSYYRDGKDYLIVASNWGKEAQPAWFYNLMEQPQTTIQVGRQRIKVEAHRIEGEDYPRLWQLVTQKNSRYIENQKHLKRQIPIVVLTVRDDNEPKEMSI